MLRAMMYCCTEPVAAGPQVLPRKLSAMENLSVITVLRAHFYDVPDYTDMGKYILEFQADEAVRFLLDCLVDHWTEDNKETGKLIN